MTDVFTQLANALGAFLGQTPSTSCVANQDCGGAGFILGAATIVIIAIIIYWALGEHAGPYGFVLAIGIPFIFVVLIGWIPFWAPVFIAVLILFRRYGPSSLGGGGGGDSTL